MSYTSSLSFDLSPIRLNYVGALRGLKPLPVDAPLVYAQTGVFESETLLCLAASNPQGQFFGLLPDALAIERARQLATQRGVDNVTFVSAASDLPSNLNYLCCEALAAQPSTQERDSFFALAEEKLVAGGLLAYRYKAYDNADQILQFLIAEYAPELSAEQALVFLSELKDLGDLYFNDHPIALAALTKAIEIKMPDSFFETCVTNEADIKSGAFETLAGLLPRNFSFVGEADIGANYIELAAPAISHPVLEKCQDHLLYEPIKDFALQRLVRNDVWVKRPVEQTFDNVELYNDFTFGITMLRERIPGNIPTQGGDVHLSSPLFTRLIDLMCTMPIGIGDFLSHPAGQGMNPDEVVGAVNVLIACGIAQPMRSRYTGQNIGSTAHPKWSTPFNTYLNTTEINEPTVRLASPVVGSAVTLSARDALVLQAVNRAGLALCAGALHPELERLMLKNPSLAAQIMDAGEATDEVIHNIVTNVVTNGMVRWYAYGLLAA